MDEKRQNPDQLLEVIRKEEEHQARGHLKIFFGYAAGVGKTYAMLKAAHGAKKHGIDVVAGYIEPHPRPKTAALLSGLEVLPTRNIKHNGITLKEFDIDAAIERKPQLLLVDELAHTNADDSRHAKRYQDIEELLKAGIDVYTTVNVQHIESLNDMVASITKVFVRERIPDSVFDGADQVELVDIEPQDLIERLNAGNIYKETQAKQAAENFFTVENLTALREIALRRCADRVNILIKNARIKNHGVYHTDEHILVCLSSSPSNAKIIRTAARMASAFCGAFTALFVETPDFSAMDDKNKKRLRDNMRLAQQLGAGFSQAAFAAAGHAHQDQIGQLSAQLPVDAVDLRVRERPAEKMLRRVLRLGHQHQHAVDGGQAAGFGLLQKSGAERIVNNVQHSFQPWVILQRHKAFAVVRIHAHGAGVYDHLHVRAPRGLLVGDGVPGSAAADEHGLRRPLGPCHSQHGLLCAARTQQHHGFSPQ